jgi:anti-sigma factor RsiW
VNDSNQPHENSDHLWEELSAYLDGELDAAGRKKVEARLASDPVYSTMLQRLERSWNALDELPRAETGQAFAQTTLQMVAIAAESSAAPPSPLRRGARGWWLAVAGSVLAAGLAGVYVGKRLYPDVNRSLLEDLPLMEHLDAYRQVENVEFLRQLNQAGLFEEEGDRAS